MKQTFVIEQDDREPELQLLVDINNLNIKFQRKRLRTGDYIYYDLVIERKTIDDLAQSILDGRIKSQVEKMKRDKRKSFVIIVGGLKDRKVDIHENAILGKVVSLVLKHNIKVLWCDDEVQFLWMLRNLCEKYDNQVEISRDNKIPS